MNMDEAPEVGGGGSDAPGRGGAGDDALEARADELEDLASLQGDPGEGVVESEPGSATEKQSGSGASAGTGPLGLGTLDEGAAAQVTGTGAPAGDEGAATGPEGP